MGRNGWRSLILIPISDGEERRLLDPNPERGFSFSADDGGSLVGHEYTMHCVAVSMKT